MPKRTPNSASLRAGNRSHHLRVIGRAACVQSVAQSYSSPIVIPNYTGGKAWCLIPPSLFSRTDLTPTQKLALGCLIGIIDQDGSCAVSNAWLGEKLAIAKGTAANMLSKLVQVGALQVQWQRTPGGTEERRIVILDQAALEVIALKGEPQQLAVATDDADAVHRDAGAFEKFVAPLSPDDQAVVRQVSDALVSTRQAGRVSQSLLDAQAQLWRQYPVDIVLNACRIYLAKDHASQGKKEAYLLGIIRQQTEHRATGRVRSDSNPQRAASTQANTTQGQRLIARAFADMQAQEVR